MFMSVTDRSIEDRSLVFLSERIFTIRDMSR